MHSERRSVVTECEAYYTKIMFGIVHCLAKFRTEPRTFCTLRKLVVRVLASGSNGPGSILIVTTNPRLKNKVCQTGEEPHPETSCVYIKYA